MSRKTHASKSLLSIFGTVALCAGLSACKINEPPVSFSVTVPQPNTTNFQVELGKKIGLGLSGQFNILNYGSIYVLPESGSNNFRFGFTLHTDVFLKKTWVNYSEVSALPTGAAFPSWLSGPVVDVQIPEANLSDVEWHFYFGTAGQYYVGAAAVIKQVNQRIPSINIEYTFTDNKGNVVVGVEFFGPKLNSDGSLAMPGGVFVGTNLTPFLPAQIQTQALALSIDETTDSSDLASLEFAPMSQYGKSQSTYVGVTGPESDDYTSASDVRAVTRRFTALTRGRY